MEIEVFKKFNRYVSDIENIVGKKPHWKNPPSDNHLIYLSFGVISEDTLEKIEKFRNSDDTFDADDGGLDRWYSYVIHDYGKWSIIDEVRDTILDYDEKGIIKREYSYLVSIYKFDT